MGAARAVGLLLGVAADSVFGDPRRGHPVAGFGRLAARAERFTYADRKLPGVVHSLGLTAAVVAAGVAVERLGLASSGRARRDHRGRDVGRARWRLAGAGGHRDRRRARRGNVEAARDRLPSLCGRDPSRLTGGELARAAVESVAENTSDAIVAPLLWGAVAGVPGLVGYRAVNTLDAMIGHRSPRYRKFGWAAARLDDVANLLPARRAAALTVAAAPVVGGSAQGAWHAWRRDAAAHPSPNAGRVEAAFAGALEIRLGGRTVYPHGVEERPVLGDGRNPDAGHVTRAVELSRVVGLLAAGAAAALALLRRRR